jgi:hypothetical protein
LAYQTLGNPTNQKEYYVWKEDYWLDMVWGNPYGCSSCTGGSAGDWEATFYTTRLAQQLTYATETFNPGTLTVTSYAPAPSGSSDLGESTAAASIGWSASTSH